MIKDNIKLRDSDRQEIGVTFSKFSGGEVHVRINDTDSMFDIGEDVFIEANIQSSDDFMALLMLHDAIIRLPWDFEIYIRLPYLPYARQDRVCNNGEAFSLKVVTNILNNLENVVSIEVADAHSTVSGALLDKMYDVSVSSILDVIDNPELDELLCSENLCLVSPDAGAEKKVLEVAKIFYVDSVLYASKIRDTMTGDIIETRIDTSVNVPCGDSNSKFLVVDDLCDGGRTFIELARKIQESYSTIDHVPEIYLYVTHGIFSHGLDELKKHYNKIYCYNVFNKDLITSSQESGSDNEFLVEIQ